MVEQYTAYDACWKVLENAAEFGKCMKMVLVLESPGNCRWRPL